MVTPLNGKLIAFVVIALVAGIGVGYGLGYAIFQPQILRLESEVSDLQSEVSTLTTDYSNLNTTYNELEANYSLLTETMDIHFIRMPSGTMQPTLQIGDTVVVTNFGLEAPYNEIDVGYTNGTIIVFEGDPLGKPGHIIIHRVVKKDYIDGVWYFTTHGDNNPASAVERFSEEYLFGRVIAIISESS